MQPTIEAHGLRKHYGKTRALDGLDLIAERGQVLAVLGPNGAGKTTFVAVEPAMTGRENLEMVARLFGQTRGEAKANAGAALEKLGLADAAGRLARTYSGGMRRRLDLGASLVGPPRPRAS